MFFLHFKPLWIFDFFFLFSLWKKLELFVDFVFYLTLKIFLWKLPIEQSSAYENVVIENNEIIEICMDDEIMEENRNVQTETNKNPKNEKEE